MVSSRFREQNVNRNWKILGVYDLSTTNTDISIPNKAIEILIFVGAINGEKQVYGGKSYTIPVLESSSNIVSEKEIYGAGYINAVATDFYAYLNNYKLESSIKTGSARMRLYYR